MKTKAHPRHKHHDLFWKCVGHGEFLAELVDNVEL